jgi:hypothetical protein
VNGSNLNKNCEYGKASIVGRLSGLCPVSGYLNLIEEIYLVETIRFLLIPSKFSPFWGFGYHYKV